MALERNGAYQILSRPNRSSKGCRKLQYAYILQGLRVCVILNFAFAGVVIHLQSGHPKLVPWTHNNLLSFARTCSDESLCGATLYSPLPLFHVRIQSFSITFVNRKSHDLKYPGNGCDCQHYLAIRNRGSAGIPAEQQTSHSSQPLNSTQTNLRPKDHCLRDSSHTRGDIGAARWSKRTTSFDLPGLVGWCSYAESSRRLFSPHRGQYSQCLRGVSVSCSKAFLIT